MPSGPVSLQLTQEDLEATKLNLREVRSFPACSDGKNLTSRPPSLQVDKNLRKGSYPPAEMKNLMERSQKEFGSEPQPHNLLYRQVLQADILND